MTTSSAMPVTDCARETPRRSPCSANTADSGSLCPGEVRERDRLSKASCHELQMSRPLARLRMIGSGSDADSGADLIKDLNFDPMNQYSAMVDAFADSVARGHLVEPAEDWWHR